MAIKSKDVMNKAKEDYMPNPDCKSTPVAPCITQLTEQASCRVYHDDASGEVA